MLLTNIEIWAIGASENAMAEDSTLNHVDVFNPRLVPTTPNNNNIYSINHMSSNGYYGFSNVNTTTEDASNNNNITQNNNITKDGNGITDNIKSVRCKKRFCGRDGDIDSDSVDFNSSAVAKRCRFDDDYAAQYCNDFFSLPSTQIGTQQCLMDTEDYSNLPHRMQFDQQNEQQVDVASWRVGHDHIYTESNFHTPSTPQNQIAQSQFSPNQQHYQDDRKCDLNVSNRKYCLISEELDYCCHTINKNKIKQDFKLNSDAIMFATTHGGCAHHYIAAELKDENFFGDF
ncbi:transcription factor mef2A isoform X2 [Teleopsis dalmanni]|uniref:transcription factor mef2A isoform X2 n=1 Tax=Teleopsis dalmanni TaxID=139649 RepID=UPI0018CF059C|nr:transcription factor mef2A isoform X2 [Teleopsis dalmanni]